jgi:hypothetical protein
MTLHMAIVINSDGQPDAGGLNKIIWWQDVPPYIRACLPYSKARFWSNVNAYDMQNSMLYFHQLGITWVPSGFVVTELRAQAASNQPRGWNICNYYYNN